MSLTFDSVFGICDKTHDVNFNTQVFAVQIVPIYHNIQDENKISSKQEITQTFNYYSLKAVDTIGNYSKQLLA